MKKVAAFIASGSGMGADAAKHLSSKGFNVAIMSSSGKGEKLAKNIGGYGYTGSNLSSKDLTEFIQNVSNKFGKIDALVNNAANNRKVENQEGKNFSRLENFPLEVWQADLAVGLAGSFLRKTLRICNI